MGDIWQEWSRAVPVALPVQRSSGREIPALAAPEHPPGQGKEAAQGHTIVLPAPVLGECGASRRELGAFLCLCCEYFH